MMTGMQGSNSARSLHSSNPHGSSRSMMEGGYQTQQPNSNSFRSAVSLGGAGNAARSVGLHSEVLETSVAMGRARAMADDDEDEGTHRSSIVSGDDDWHRIPPGEDDVMDMDRNNGIDDDDDDLEEDGTHVGEVMRTNKMMDDDVSALH
eukprot:6459436-Ditylum_brightwellii.AAC.1